MVGEQEVEVIDYLKVIWKRKGLIIGGTLLASATALVVSLSLPKTYQTSRTLKIGRLPSTVSKGEFIEGKLIEKREDVIDRLKDHRALATVIEELHLGVTTKKLQASISIDTKYNPHVRYTVQASDPEIVTQIADGLADYIIKVHRPLFEKGMEIPKEYEAELALNIRSAEERIHSIKNILSKKMDQDPDIDFSTVLEATIEDRERRLVGLRRELKLARLSQLGSENTSVIAADAPPHHPVKPWVTLNVVLAGTLGLVVFTFVGFFLEYLEEARGDRVSMKRSEN